MSICDIVTHRAQRSACGMLAIADCVPIISASHVLSTSLDRLQSIALNSRPRLAGRRRFLRPPTPPAAVEANRRGAQRAPHRLLRRLRVEPAAAREARRRLRRLRPRRGCWCVFSLRRGAACGMLASGADCAPIVSASPSNRLAFIEHIIRSSAIHRTDIPPSPRWPSQAVPPPTASAGGRGGRGDSTGGATARTAPPPPAPPARGAGGGAGGAAPPPPTPPPPSTLVRVPAPPRRPAPAAASPTTPCRAPPLRSATPLSTAAPCRSAAPCIPTRPRPAPLSAAPHLAAAPCRPRPTSPRRSPPRIAAAPLSAAPHIAPPQPAPPLLASPLPAEARPRPAAPPPS